MKHKRFFRLFPALAACLLVLSMLLPAWAAAPSYSGYERSMVAIVNRHRMAAGMNPLSMFAALQNAAGVRAKELHTLYDLNHLRPDGSPWHTVLAQQGVSAYGAGENIAYYQTSSSEVMTAWMNSTGHRENIMTSSFVHIGAGYDKGAGEHDHAWTQVFASHNCTYTNLRLLLPAGGVVVAEGTRADNMGVTAVMDCSVHGESHFPLITAMASPETAPPGRQRHHGEPVWPDRRLPGDGAVPRCQ